MSESLENCSDYVPGTKNSSVSHTRQSDHGDSLPRVSLLLDLVAQVEDQLPIFPGKVLVSGFR